MTKTEQEIATLTLPIVKTLGYELYDVEYLKEGQDWYLRFYIDSEKGIDIDDCEKVSNELGALLDSEDPIKTSYILEVSSCGLERPLRNEEHYMLAIGKNIGIKLFKSINKQKEIEGKLLRFENKKIILETKDGNLEIGLDDVSSAKILYEWEE